LLFFLFFPRLAADTAGRDLPAAFGRIYRFLTNYAFFSCLSRGTGRGAGGGWQGALAAGKAREARRQEAGEGSSVHFSMDDNLAAMAARIEPITMLGYELRQAAKELFRLLWPMETLPSELANLVKWLENAPNRLCDWKESAARAGADMALSFVLSWYEEVSLDQLETRWADVEGKLSAEAKSRQLARACAFADFVNHNDFISDPNPPEEEVEDEDMADTEDAPEADPAPGSDVPPAGPSPAGA
jgi:hypothetical protein